VAGVNPVEEADGGYGRAGCGGGYFVNNLHFDVI
jgi:hypothetical protein